MTDKAKLEKIKKLADAMYYAAFNLTTDASLLRKAMDDYHQFIINEYHKEEPVSGNIDFEQELYKAFGQVKDFTLGIAIAKRFYDMGKNSKDSQEPVSEELKDVSMEWLRPQLDKSYSSYGETKMMELTRFDGYAMLDAIEFGAQWQKEKEYTCYEEAFEDGASWKKEHLWKPADGDDLPEIDREVIALTQPYPNDEHLRVVFAHRPNKYAKVWNSDLGEEQIIEVERYGKGEWNIPNVKYWIDLDIQKL